MYSTDGGQFAYHTKSHILRFLVFFGSANAADLSGNKWSFYSGTFDFSDEGARSQLFGLQHQNPNLYRNTFLGEVSPITVAMITADNALYFYSGIETTYSIGMLNITPSFAPGSVSYTHLTLPTKA